MTKKNILKVTLNAYLKYSILAIIILSPVFYFAISYQFNDESKELLEVMKNDFMLEQLPDLAASEVDQWNNYNSAIQILQGKCEKETISSLVKYDSSKSEDAEFKVLTAPISIQQQDYTLQITLNTFEFSDLIEIVVLVFISFVLILFSGIYLFTRYFSIQLWQPFNQSLEKVEHYKVNDKLKIALSSENIVEFDRLNTALNTLMETNSYIYAGQKEFIENATHELQTPLAILQTKVDRLSQSENLTESQSKLLEEMNTTLHKMGSLNKNLLLLSRIENEQFNANDLTNWSVLLDDYLANFEHLITQKKLDVRSVIFPEVRLLCHNYLAEIMIRNLMTNAIKYTQERGKIDITLDEKSFCVSNEGSTPLDASKLFVRFSKGISHDSGNGLGLAICSEIAKAAGWKLSYVHVDGRHCWRVGFVE